MQRCSAREQHYKHGVRDSDLEGRTHREFFEMSSRFKKQNRRVTDLRWEETRQDHAIRSSVAITKLPLCRDILTKKKNNNKKKENCKFFENIFSLDFF